MFKVVGVGLLHPGTFIGKIISIKFHSIHTMYLCNLKSHRLLTLNITLISASRPMLPPTTIRYRYITSIGIPLAFHQSIIIVISLIAVLTSTYIRTWRCYRVATV